MGHQRLGKLPAHRLLPEIVRFLVTGGAPTEALVDQVTEVGQDALKLALKDPVFVEALWLLVRVPQAAASKDFPAALSDLGMAVVAPTSLSDVLVSYDRAIEKVQRRLHAGATDLGEIARRAGLAALGEAVQGALPTLWAPTATDVRASVAALKGTEQFAALAHRFYANFVERVIHYYVDRNLHNMVGAGRAARSVYDLRAFNDSIRRHCDESALIMRAFAKDWLGKNHYKDGKQISKDDVRRFSAHAVEKIRIELDIRKGAP
ncbi:MAG: hypothetical protein KIS68_00295 [Bauldia sp.]|nr:hypothetical protein [Bauldia sp.]